VDIVYACRNPIISYYITPESRPNEGGMKGIEEPRTRAKCWCIHCEIFGVRTMSQGPAHSSLKVKLAKVVKHNHTSIFICCGSSGYNLE